MSNMLLFPGLAIAFIKVSLVLQQSGFLVLILLLETLSQSINNLHNKVWEILPINTTNVLFITVSCFLLVGKTRLSLYLALMIFNYLYEFKASFNLSFKVHTHMCGPPKTGASLSVWASESLTHYNWMWQVMWHKNYWWHHSTLSKMAKYFNKFSHVSNGI